MVIAFWRRRRRERSSSCFQMLLQVVLLTTIIIGAATALPEGFREVGVAATREGRISTITFVPNEGGEGAVIFAAIKDGFVELVSNPDDTTSSTTQTILDLTDKVCSNGERGIHQVLAHPDFLLKTKRFVYISYTYDKYGGCELDDTTGAVNRLSRFEVKMDDYSILKNSEDVFIETSSLPNKVHNGGDIMFGNDGYLYLTIGDGGSRSSSQDLGSLLGTIIRLTEDGDIPLDNPFQGSGTSRCNQGPQPGFICQEIFAYGFRNPYRFSINPNSRDDDDDDDDDGTTHFYVGDVGGEKWEEISEGGTNFAGMNYGWSEREGPCRVNSKTNCAPPSSPNLVDPIFWYSHNNGGAAVTGIAPVPKGIWPSEYDNAILYLEFVQGEMHIIRNDRSACRDCNPPIPSWSNTLFHNLDDSNVGRATQLIFGPYQDTQALYYTIRVGSSTNIRRIIYEGVINRAPIAHISTNITSAPVDTPVNFNGSSSTDPDGDVLEFLWKFGDGTTSNLVSPSHQFNSPGNFNVELIVTDIGGFSGTANIVVDIGAPPIPTIEFPPEGTTFAVGDIFTLIGSAVDSNGNDMDASSLSWEVRQHHNTHYHPFLDPIIGNNIKIDRAPSPEDFLAATDNYLEVLLTATDSSGYSATTSVNVMPKIIQLSFDSIPSGMDLILDDYTITTPISVSSWVNHPLNVLAKDKDDLYFQWWSDGGDAFHIITVMESLSEVTFVARFANCRRLWSDCITHDDCCSGLCSRVGHCRATTKLGRTKLSMNHHGGAAAAAAARQQSGRIRGRRRRRHHRRRG